LWKIAAELIDEGTRQNPDCRRADDTDEDDHGLV